MRFNLHNASRRFFGLAAVGLLAVPWAVLAAVPDVAVNLPKDEPPKECDSTTSTTCDCESSTNSVQNGCVFVTLDLGATTPWTGAAPVRLKIYTRESGPSLSTPEQLKLVLGYTLMKIGSDRTSAGAPATVEFAEPTGRTVRFRFAEGSSVGTPLLALPADGNVRLQMVDAEGWATLSAPAFYDLYPGDGSVWRYSASPAAADFGVLVHRIDPRGVVRTWEDMGVTVLRDAAGRLRQVATRTRLADIVADSDAHYAVTVYPLVEEPDTDPDTGLLVPPTAAPVRVLDVRRGASEQELFVGLRKGSGDIRTYRYEAKNGDWELTLPSGVVDTKELYYNGDETGAVRLQFVRDASGALLRRTELNYADRPWGWALTNKIEGLEGELKNVTSWSYVADGPNQGKVAEKTEPNGNRIVYEYDAQNRVVRESMPLVEEETLYSYEPVDPSDPPLLCDTRPRCVVRKMQGVEIRRTYYVYGTNGVDVVERVGEPGAAYGGTNVLRTVTTYYPVTGSVVDGLVRSVRHEDGTVDDYAYDLANGVWTETVTHVHEQAPDIVPMRTTRSVRVYNALGQLVDSRNDLCTIGVEDLVPQADWTPIERLQYAYDVDGNEIRREDLAGRLWTAEWAGNCCGKISETDWQGITTTYAYDAEGRVIAKQTGSILTETAYDVLGRVTNVSRRGIATADRTASAVRPSSYAYDSFGHLTLRDGEDGIRHVYTYAYRPEGGEVRTVTEAPGTECERVTMTTFDAAGRRIREFRNSSLRRSFLHAPLLETIYEGSKGTNSPVWIAMEIDLLDRIIETRKPGFGGAVLNSRNAFDEFGNTVEIEDGYTSAAPGSAHVVTSRRLFSFDTFRSPVLSAEDVNRNGRIDLAGPDAVVSNMVGYVVENGSLWSTSETFVFPDEGSDRSVSAERSQKRLTGLGTEEENDSIGNSALISETIVRDSLGNTMTSRRLVNRQAQCVLNIRQIPTSTVSQESITKTGALVAFRSSENVTTTNRYDALLRPVATVDLFGNATTTAYDEFGRIAWREDPSGARTSFGYDALGRQVSVMDALGNEKTTTFDVDGNAVSLRGAQYPVDYTYDEYGRMATMSTYRTEDLAHGDVTTWLRDEATGLVTNKVYADGNGPTYAYTPDGKPTRTTWARGAWFENVYDAQGRVVQVLHDDATLDAEMGYDRLGRLVSSSVPAASYRYAYDILGHARNEVSIIAGVTNTIIRDYDAFGRQTRLRIAGSDYDESFAYDELGRLSVIGIPGSTVTYAYTPDSLDAGYSIHTSSNAILTRALIRDPQRRGLISSVSNLVNGIDSGSSFNYTFDALGRPIARNLDEFGYNARGEVAWARYGTNTLSDLYFYDPIGNFVSNRLDGKWIQFMPNTLNQYGLIENNSSQSIVYDPDGNLLTNGVMSYGYDSKNRLSMISSNELPVLIMDYDAKSRIFRTKDTSVTNFCVYDDWNAVLSTEDKNGSIDSRDWFWGKDISGTLQGSGGIGGLLSELNSKEHFLSQYDNHGNIVSYVDSFGNNVASFSYDIYGRTVSEGLLAKTLANQYFTKPYIPQGELVYFGRRFYCAAMGRWMSRDPLQERIDINLYLANRNNALVYFDYLGLAALCDCLQIDLTVFRKHNHIILASYDEAILDEDGTFHFEEDGAGLFSGGKLAYYAVNVKRKDENSCSCFNKLHAGPIVVIHDPWGEHMDDPWTIAFGGQRTSSTGNLSVRYEEGTVLNFEIEVFARSSFREEKCFEKKFKVSF